MDIVIFLMDDKEELALDVGTKNKNDNNEPDPRILVLTLHYKGARNNDFCV